VTPAHNWRVASAYGLMAAPLAFAALPLYVLFPQFYATNLGVSLAALGGLLLVVRALDAVTDPLIGRLLDTHLRSNNLMPMAVVAALVLLVGFGALFKAQSVDIGAANVGKPGARQRGPTSRAAALPDCLA
jgi:Na+/melibiose symporter-like transporter